MAQFNISPLMEADTHDMINVYYETFPPDIVELFGGTLNEDGQEAARLRYLHTMKTDPLERWIKITDSASGKLVGCSNWRLHTLGLSDEAMDSPPVWLDAEKRADAERTQKRWEVRRRRIIGGEPHVYLHIMFIHPAYQRKGAGVLMMNWGCQLADHLGLPAWVEASPEGRGLYEKKGFRLVELYHKAGPLDADGSILRRPQKSSIQCEGDTT